MASKRVKPKGTIAGLRSVQTLGALAVPATLEQVPEGDEIKAEPNKPAIFASDDWTSVKNAVKEIFIDSLDLDEQGQIFKLHQNVKNILRSKTGTFLCDCYKEWITKEMNTMAERLRGLRGLILLHSLENTWTEFFSKILPMLEAILLSVKPKGRLSIRSTTLAAFRDAVVFSADVEGAMRREPEAITPGLEQMILILQNVNDSYPPCKNKLRLENMAAQVCSSFLGYFGLYENGNLIVTSNEPTVAARRRPSAVVGGPRRISRPFSVQPQQMDTLNQMFKNAIRHKTLKADRI